MKRVVGLLIAATLIIAVFAGCSGGGQAAPTSSGQAAAASSQTAGVDSAKSLKFGYVVNDMSHEWYQNIVNGAKAQAEKLGVELKVSDAAMDVGKQVTQLENYINEGVDVLIITPVDVKALSPVMDQAKKAGIPVVTESNVVEGAETYVGINNLEGGVKAGKWFAEYATANNIDPQILIVGLPAFEDCRLRVEGFKQGMDEAGLKYTILQEVDGQGSKETSLKVSQDALTANPDINVIFGINDNSTTGGMAAYKEAGFDESKLTAIGFGFEGNVGREALLSGGSYKASVAMFPDYMGVSLLNAAMMAANGEDLPDNYESGTIVITNDNFADFYTKDGDNYTTNFDAITALLNK
ncbi:MAG: substrate-binding domain-containing protein [Oscillospiraceae bacterium]|nr:substrate-binding domain-containing protein [Oscillospiraceae bacterium]